MPRKPAAPEDLSAKKALALEVIARLKKEYPDAACTLDYDHAWQLLVSVRLAAQCTDARVNIVVEDLFAKYPSVAALAAAEPEEIEAIVKPCGLGHSKARDISACMRMLRDKYDCKVPTTFEELLSLPGVGRKSANLIMGDVFGKPAIVTDTHCIRLCNKIGLVDGIKEPQKVEMALWKIIPPEEGSDLCHRFVLPLRQGERGNLTVHSPMIVRKKWKLHVIFRRYYNVWSYFQSAGRCSGRLHCWPHHGQ